MKKSHMGSSSWSSADTYTTDAGKKFFVKVGLGQDVSMFAGEALGLQAMYGAHPRSDTSLWADTPSHALKILDCLGPLICAAVALHL